MAFTELELAQIKRTVGGLCNRRIPPERKAQLSLDYRIAGHDVIILERRPRWDGSPGFAEEAAAKLKFTRRTGTWRLLWQRADMKWHAYTPDSPCVSLEDFVDEIDVDPYGCFFG
jgi:hypothetical protein